MGTHGGLHSGLGHGHPLVSIVKGDLTIWEAYGVVNSQFFLCKISLKCEKHFGVQSLQRLFFCFTFLKKFANW